MKAVILAGGKGTRLYPITLGIPKPLIPIVRSLEIKEIREFYEDEGSPILELIVEYLRKHGVNDLIITVGYRGRYIEKWFSNAEKEYGVNIKISKEDPKNPLGTAGCLLPLKDELKNTFLVMAGDNLAPDLDLRSLLDFHKKHGGIATIVGKRMDFQFEYGIIQADKDGLIENFMEKPREKKTVATMIYALQPDIFKLITTTPCDFAREIIPQALMTGERVFCYHYNGRWVDVGSLEQLVKAHKALSI